MATRKSFEPKKVLLPRRLCPAIPNPILPTGSDCDCSSWSWVHGRGKLRVVPEERGLGLVSNNKNKNKNNSQASPGRMGELVFTEMPSCRVSAATSGSTRLSLIPGEKEVHEEE